MAYLTFLLSKPCSNQGREWFWKKRLFHQYSWNSELETTWIRLIGWPLMTSNAWLCNYVLQNFLINVLLCNTCSRNNLKCFLKGSFQCMIVGTSPYTLMPVYHCHKPVLWNKWTLASSLLQAIKTCRQACPPGYLLHFS